MYIEIIILFIIIIKTKCSIVIDDKVQNGVHLLDYCPEIGVCTEGSHVMCRYYNPNREMGPMCAGVENASMTEEYASLALDLVNGMRSRAARGLAMGYNNELLPRAYGLFRLQWDPELATLAQVWANQCVIQVDPCRATKKFPDPGQLASITRFVSSNWIPLSQNRENNLLHSLGFNKEKVLYAIKSSIGSWYRTSESIDFEIITDRNSSWSEELIRNPYLQILDGSVTHMGCGTSAFKEYRYTTETTFLIYNVVRIICNFSSRVHDRRGIYNTIKPTKSEYTAECGCPPGYVEDSGCLCYEIKKNQTKLCINENKPEKIHLVLVPIITFEDYPRAKADAMINRKNKMALHKIQNPCHDMVNRRYVTNRQLNKNLSTTSISKKTSRKLKGNIQSIKIKIDVAPRKDFSKSKNLLSNYLSKRRTFNLQNKVLNSEENKHLRRSLPIKSIEPLRDNYIRRKTYNNWEDEKPYDLIRRKNTSSNIKASNDDDTKLLNLLNNFEDEANKITVNKRDRRVLNNGIRKIFSALKNSHLINNNRNIIYNKKITDKKPLYYVPFKENHKLKKYEDLFKDINLKQRNLKPKNLSIMSRKYQNNNPLINSLTGKELERYSYKNFPVRHIPHTPEYIRNYIKSEEFFPDNRRIYYYNRINDVRRQLKANYMKYIKTGNGLQIRPTFEASHLRYKTTLPNIQDILVENIAASEKTTKPLWNRLIFITNQNKQ